MNIFQFKKKKKIPSLWLGIIAGLFLSSLVLAALSGILIKNESKDNYQAGRKLTDILITPAKAAEIYPEFFCPCCGKPLDPDNICCGAMKQRIDYIDNQVNLGLAKDEVIVAMVKEFGLDSLIKSEIKEKVKRQLIAQAGSEAPQIVFERENYDWGQVSQAEGEVITYFKFTNDGKSELIIDKLDTSCGCTSAAIVYQGTEGPVFTMAGHGKKNPTNWQVAIAPGDSAQVKVTFDPNAHGEQKEDILSITRTITIYSNDPVEFGKQLRIELDQIR